MKLNPFELSNAEVLLTNFNPRAENEGKDKVPAADLKLQIKTGNEILAMLHPSMRSALYDKPDASNADLADQGRADEPIARRFPKMSAFAYDLDLENYTLTIHHGLGGKSDIVIADCKVNAFRVECQEGGTVVIDFRVQGHPGEKESGKLCTLIQQTITITLEPPEEVQAELQKAA